MKIRGFIITLLCLNMTSEVIAQIPISLDWHLAGQLPPVDGASNPGVAGAVIGTNNNVLFVAGGANFPDQLPWKGGKKSFHQKIYLFGLHNNEWKAFKTNAVMPIPIAYAANCTTSKGIIAAGGENEKGLLSTVYLITCDPKTFSVAITSLPSLPVPTTNASAVSIHESIYVLGGETSQGTTSDCWKLNLSKLNNGWEKIASLPAPRSFACAEVSLTDNEYSIFFMGGRNKTMNGISQFSKAIFTYDPATNLWKESNLLPYGISAGTSIALHNQGLLLFGGDTGSRFTLVEQKIQEIEKAVGEEKEALIQQKNELLASHPGFSNEILFYHVASGEISTLGKLPFQTPVTTTALMVNNQIIIPSGEIRAGVRTPNILMATLKFK